MIVSPSFRLLLKPLEDADKELNSDKKPKVAILIDALDESEWSSHEDGWTQVAKFISSESG